MSDPAIDAAQRANVGWAPRNAQPLPQMVDAAREMAAPIRELIERAEDRGDYVYIDAIRKLIYTTEELDRD